METTLRKMEQQGSKPPSMGEQMRTHFLLEVNFINIVLGFNFISIMLDFNVSLRNCDRKILLL